MISVDVAVKCETCTNEVRSQVVRRFSNEHIGGAVDAFMARLVGAA